MKLTNFFTIAAVCVAAGVLEDANVHQVHAKDTALSNNPASAAQSVLKPVESGLDVKTEDCLEKGFDAETLDCRVCNLLALTLSVQLEENVSSNAVVVETKQRATEEAVATCQRCCTDVAAIDALSHTQQYARVVLEVCTCKFGRLPKIANFVHHHAANYPRLEIEYLNARMPHLIFYDDAGEKKEEVSIASWDEETISEFIAAKLKTVEDEPQADPESTSDETTASVDENSEEIVDEEVDVAEESAVDESEQSTEDDVVEVEVSAEAQ